jgi:flagellar biosynthesis chaperone FliJ
MEVLMVKNWKELTRNRKEWNKLVEKAKTRRRRIRRRRRRRRNTF